MSGSGSIAQEERAAGFKEWLAENAPGFRVVSEVNAMRETLPSRKPYARLCSGANPSD